MVRKVEGFKCQRGWSGVAMVLGKRPAPGRPTILITVGQGPTALPVGAGGGCLDISSLIYPFFPFSPSLWETARYRLKHCLKGPLKHESINQSIKCQKYQPPTNWHYMAAINLFKTYDVMFIAELTCNN